ncbi:hypothetical protein [Bacillus sp. B-jedd]|uniref:hypothetical protein n=1 Tax=Bacillus sp. B-jedd TaxID=1476857 RepID=UPI0005155AE9|nr:hypothetical protein [Bacillus sp. B-jedd]CEG27095.1 hypothetical protein BN1002_01951 [Bacillus sp. B-jedd]
MKSKNKFMKLFVLFLCLAGIFYYFRPLSAEQVFPSLKRAEKVTIMMSFEEGKGQRFINEEYKGKDLEKFIRFLETATYTRAFGEKNIQSQANAYDILIVLDSNNYSVVINDDGDVVVDTRNSKKKYTIYRSKDDSLISLIDQMLEGK